MRKWLLIALVFIAAPVLAQDRASAVLMPLELPAFSTTTELKTLPEFFQPNGGQSETLTVDNTSGGKAITAAVLSGMAGCSLRLESAEIRWSIDFSNPPTTTYGSPLEIGDVMVWTNINLLKAARFIRTGATSGSLKVQCWPSS